MSNMVMKKLKITAIEGYLDEEDEKFIGELFNLGKISFLTNISTFRTRSGRNYLFAYRHRDTFYARIEKSKKEGYGERAVTFEIMAA